MFGERHTLLKLSRFEHFILLGLAVIIAFLVVVADVGISVLPVGGEWNITLHIDVAVAQC